MAVYTEVSFDEADSFLQSLQLGKLQQLLGCTGGIENTNYFATTDQASYVLTLFERLTAQQVPFYLGLMKHLAQRSIPVPEPAEDRKGELMQFLQGKPTTVVNRLPGSSVMSPSPLHCAEVGAMLARMHLAGKDFPLRQAHLRGLQWWNETVPVVLGFLDSVQGELITSELAYQNHVASQSSYQALPRGPIHADLFRDNALFEPPLEAHARPRLSGFFDFYFAGVDAWLFDIAVCLNDWCVDITQGSSDPERASALVEAYQSVRPLEASERQLMPAFVRAAALRFWISRLWDLHLPREASVLQPHDPGHFERVLRQQIVRPLTMERLQAYQTTALSNP